MVISILQKLRGQCPDDAHARASSVFSSKDNKTVILTRQDFFPDRTADGDLLFTFSSNILDFQRSLSAYLKFGSRQLPEYFGILAAAKSYRGLQKNSTSISPEKFTGYCREFNGK